MRSGCSACRNLSGDPVVRARTSNGPLSGPVRLRWWSCRASKPGSIGPLSRSATTVPDFGALATPSTGRLPLGCVSSLRDVSVLSRSSAVFPAAILRFCCRAAVNRPRATLRFTMALYRLELGGEGELLVGSCWFAPFSESEQLGSRFGSRPVSKPFSPVNWNRSVRVASCTMPATRTSRCGVLCAASNFEMSRRVQPGFFSSVSTVSTASSVPSVSPLTCLRTTADTSAQRGSYWVNSANSRSRRGPTPRS